MYRVVFLNSVVLLLFGCAKKNEIAESKGYALGTSYAIKYQSNELDFEEVEKAVDSLFDVVNKSMSTYFRQSDISKINRGDSLVQVDEHFVRVFEKATAVWKQTSGYFDPTIGAWVNAYGFGPDKPLRSISEKQRDSLKNLTGWGKVKLTKNRNVVKENKTIFIDFNALGKGYAVDVIATYLREKGVGNFLVEIGGEIVAEGKNIKTNRDWTIGIDDPNQKEQRSYIHVLTLNNEAMATSGNYRKFRIDSITKQKYVHSINPLTGIPVQSNILSTTVLSSDCMTADAYATALMVMPLEKGKELIERLSNVEAYWVVAEGEELKEVFSKGWKKE